MFLPDSLAGWVVALGAAALICLLLQSEDTPAAEPSAGGADAPTCRICYAGAEAGRLFTPCLCRGSMAHVHVACLNEWRKQSVNPRSLYLCDACGYAYRIQRTAAAAWLQSEGCVWLASGLLVLVLLGLGASAPLASESLLYEAARWRPRDEVAWWDARCDLAVRYISLHLHISPYISRGATWPCAARCSLRC